MIKFPACERHQGYAYQFINLQKGHVQLACGECLYSLQDNQNKVDFSQIISIEKALNQPETLIQKLTGQELFSNYFVTMSKNNGEEFTHFVNQMEQLVSQFQIYLNEMLENFKNHIALSIQSRTEIQHKILDKFIDLLKELVNDDRKEECQQFELRLSNYVNEIQQDKGLNQNLIEIMKNRQSFLLEDLKNKIDLNNIVKKSTEITDLVEQLNGKIRSNYSEELWEKLKSNILADEELLLLLERIQQSKQPTRIQKLQPIYISALDGLSPKKFQNKIGSVKGDLLFIVKRINQKAVGGFCSLKVNNFSYYKNDNNSESFLFIQNSNQDKFGFHFQPQTVRSMFQQQQLNDFELFIGMDLQTVILKQVTNSIFDVGFRQDSIFQIAEIEIYQAI